MTDKDFNSDVEVHNSKAFSVDGGVYLVVVDNTPEFKSALNVACSFAKAHKARVGLLYVIEDEEFQQWGSVEEQILLEQRRKAEKVLDRIALDISEGYELHPSFYIERGDVQDVLTEIMDRDYEINALVLGAGRGVNPLISSYSGKGLSQLKVPLFVIPDVSGA